MEIPFTYDPRPDTGLASGRFGMWLFLASEAMLFGGLYSGYVLLRTGSAAWPRGWDRLAFAPGVLATAVLVISSVTMALAVRAAHAGAIGRAARLAAATSGAGAAFLALTAAEWWMQIAAGQVPAADTFYATWFTLTGLHAAHVAGGAAALGWLALRSGDPRFRDRLPLVALYWQFVDLVWLVLFGTFYLT